MTTTTPLSPDTDERAIHLRYSISPSGGFLFDNSETAHYALKVAANLLMALSRMYAMHGSPPFWQKYWAHFEPDSSADLEYWHRQYGIHFTMLFPLALYRAACDFLGLTDSLDPRATALVSEESQNRAYCRLFGLGSCEEVPA